MVRNPDMEPVNSWQPKALKEQILGALKGGESLADFCRKAFVRELKKRGIKAQVPDVQMGRPRSIYPDDWPSCPACGQPCMDGKDTCGNVECG